MIILLLLILILSLLGIFRLLSCGYKTSMFSPREQFKALCDRKDYISEYPYKDKQNTWYSEYTNAFFDETLSNRKFVVNKNTINLVETTVMEYVEIWINNVEQLKKENSRLRIVSLVKDKNEEYTLIIHRNARNHGKVLHLKMKEDSNNIILSNIKVIGVKNEYEITPGALYDIHDESKYLQYEKLSDMWSVTNDEILGLSS